MTHIDTFALRKVIGKEEFDYVALCSALSQYSGVRQKIHELMQTQVITRVKKGLYVFGADYRLAPICKEILANLIYGPSYISLEYALAFHGLIPERVEVITSVTPKRDKDFKTPLGHFTYRYLVLPKYASGIQQVWIDRTHPVLMATIEKAICDYLILMKVPPFADSREAGSFLEKDLRIGQEQWHRLQLDEFEKLNELYASLNITKLIKALKTKDNS